MNSTMLLSDRSKQALSFGLKPADAWLVILGFVLFTAACLLLRFGQLVNYGFPAGAFLVAAYLYRKYPVLYFSFALWMWFLCSWVRRLVDFQIGWVNPSPVLLTPLLVAFIAILGLCINLPKIIKQGGVPFLLSAASVIYGFGIGILSLPANTVILNFLGWFTPILLGLHLYIHWQRFPEFKKTIYTTFLWGTFVVGVYGVIQYFVAPEWDKVWLNNMIYQLGIVTFGNPEPLEIRVFSTMHSPQALGGMLMPGLLLLLTNKSKFKFLAMLAGYLSFLLSSARSAWLSWLVGLLSYAGFLKLKFQLRLILSLLIATLLLMPLITIEPFSTAISPRLETLSNVKEDNSFQDRVSMFNLLLSRALTSVVGDGLGGAADIGNDNGLLTLLFSLGWIGSVPYLVGVISAFIRLVKSSSISTDLFVGSCLAIALGSFSQITMNVVTSGFIAVTLWVFLGAGMASVKYQNSQQSMFFR
jgi:hypothetical protein